MTRFQVLNTDIGGTKRYRIPALHRGQDSSITHIPQKRTPEINSNADAAAEVQKGTIDCKPIPATYLTAGDAIATLNLKGSQYLCVCVLFVNRSAELFHQ